MDANQDNAWIEEGGRKERNKKCETWGSNDIDKRHGSILNLTTPHTEEKYHLVIWESTSCLTILYRSCRFELPSPRWQAFFSWTGPSHQLLAYEQRVGTVFLACPLAADNRYPSTKYRSLAEQPSGKMATIPWRDSRATYHIMGKRATSLKIVNKKLEITFLFLELVTNFSYEHPWTATLATYNIPDLTLNI